MIIDAFARFEKAFALTGLTFGTPLVSTNSLDTAGNAPTSSTLVGATVVDSKGAGVPNPIGPGGVIGGTRLHDIGRGKPVLLLAQVVTAATSGGSATLTEEFISADDAALGTNVTSLQSSAAVAVASLVAGYRFPFKTVPSKVRQRYVGMRHTAGTANFTAGNITCALVLGMDDNADIIG